MIPVQYFFVLSALLFFIGVYGFCTRRNLVAMLISIELVLNAADLNFAVFNRIQYKLDGDKHSNEVTTCTEAIYSDEEQEC